MSNIDPTVQAILTKYNAPKDAVWLHKQSSKYIAKHSALEVIAANANIVFDLPQIIQCDLLNKAVCVCVKGVMGERSEWSFGEATHYNSQNQYYAAMAEKRAKDRVILKLLGLHGTVYSDQESEDFEETPKKQTAAVKNALFNEIMSALNGADDSDDLRSIWVSRTEDLLAVRAQSETFFDNLERRKDELKIQFEIKERQQLYNGERHG